MDVTHMGKKIRMRMENVTSADKWVINGETKWIWMF